MGPPKSAMQQHMGQAGKPVAIAEHRRFSRSAEA
jgi:hypothetical protein